MSLELLPQFASFIDLVFGLWFTIHGIAALAHSMRIRFLSKWLTKRIHVDWNNYLAFGMAISCIVLLLVGRWIGAGIDVWIAFSLWWNRCSYCMKDDDDDDGLWEKVKDWVTIKPKMQRQPVRI